MNVLTLVNMIIKLIADGQIDPSSKVYIQALDEDGVGSISPVTLVEREWLGEGGDLAITEESGAPIDPQATSVLLIVAED